MNRVSYRKVKHKLNPLDLLLFKGSEIVSTSIQFLQNLEVGNGDWSHCGIIINTSILPTIKNGKPNKLYVWESTLSGPLNDDVYDTEGNIVFGVQIRSLKQVVKAYNQQGRMIAWAKLKYNPCLQQPDETTTAYQKRFQILQNQLIQLHQKYHHQLYETNCLTLLASLFQCLRPAREYVQKHTGFGNNTMFCSELVATIYCDLGILDKSEVDPEDVLPVDFTLINHNDEWTEFTPVNKTPPVILLP